MNATKTNNVYGPASGQTHFVSRDGELYLQELTGLPCGFDGGADGADCAQHLFSLTTNHGLAMPGDFELVEHSLDSGCVNIVLRCNKANVTLRSIWKHDARSGVWSRKDFVRNDGGEAVTLHRCLAAFGFPTSRYEIYSQASRWCRENQGRWQELSHGSLTLASEFGRTTQGATPYACLRDVDTGLGLAIHVIPHGNWILRFTRKTKDHALFPLLLEAGLADGDLRLSLPPGETRELPELLLQPLGDNPVEHAAPKLHSYLLRHHLRPDERDIPFVYNTWFDEFGGLDVDRLRRQLEAARDVGCEVFVIDAGWYGKGNKDWWQTVGDWREATTRSFYGNMKDFAEDVRAAGLGFGIWMEPERFADEAPILEEHPDWFFKSINGQHYPNLENPAVYEYTLGEMSRLVETYELAWMKVDFNHPVGPDPTGAESSGYYEAWYRLLDTLREKYPQTIFEGCASGGLRMDINTASRFPLHFQSDSIEPVDMLRITEGALLRLTPGKLGKWLGLRGVGRTIPVYGQKPGEIPVSVAAAGGATWAGAGIWDPRFVAAVALCGPPGLTGDVSSLEPETRDMLRRVIKFYKTYRKVLVRCVAHMLTPVKPIEDRTGWSAVQLQPLEEETSFLLAYRLDDVRGRMRFALRNLSPDRTYRVTSWTASKESHREMTGPKLMEAGLDVELPQPNRADVFIIEPV